MSGPQLVHWVARCGPIDAAGAVLRAAGIDSGEPRQAERMTPQGLLQWRIGVRADGHRPLGGAGPALIEWGDRHPTDSMPASGVTLQAMRVAGWPAALAATLPAAIEGDPRGEAPPISVTLATSRGPVILETPDLGT
jgi:hypothetical protein